jgi:hypothetical protein
LSVRRDPHRAAAREHVGGGATRHPRFARPTPGRQSIWIAWSPSWRRSPACSTVRPTRSPFTIVPLVDARSRSTHTSSRNVSCACRRDTLAFARTTSHAGCRPTAAGRAREVQHERQRCDRRTAGPGGGTHALDERPPGMPHHAPWTRPASTEREVPDQPLRIDQARAEQQAEPIRVRLLAQQALGERRVQYSREALACATEPGHRANIPRAGRRVHARRVRASRVPMVRIGAGA